jgi:molybdopterin synthase catalytic subunit
VKCGDAEAAAKLAFKAGMHWQKHKLDEATKAGLDLVKFRRMGAHARRKYVEDTEREWFFDALRIEDETGVMSTREQARRIIAAGKGRGASLTTIRDVIADRKARMKKNEE